MILEDNEFASYTFTKDELKQAFSYTPLQIAGFRTLISEAMHDRVALEVDVDNITSFIQQEAAIKGEIGILNRLLDLDKVHNQPLTQSTQSTQR